MLIGTSAGQVCLFSYLEIFSFCFLCYFVVCLKKDFGDVISLCLFFTFAVILNCLGTIVAIRGYDCCRGGFYCDMDPGKMDVCRDKLPDTSEQSFKFIHLVSSLRSNQVCFSYFFRWPKCTPKTAGTCWETTSTSTCRRTGRVTVTARGSWSAGCWPGGWAGREDVLDPLCSRRSGSRSKVVVEAVFFLQMCFCSNLTACRL